MKVELNSIKMDNQAYVERFRKLDELIHGKAQGDWNMRYGGFTPSEGEYGRTCIVPGFFAPLTRYEEDVDPSVFTWVGGEAVNVPVLHLICSYKRFFTGGKHIIFQGKNQRQTVSGIKFAFMGMVFSYRGEKPPLKDLQFIIGDTMYSASGLDKFITAKGRLAFTFEEGFLVDEDTRFIFYGDFEVKGKRWLRAIPLGYCLYRHDADLSPFYTVCDEE